MKSRCNFWVGGLFAAGVVAPVSTLVADETGVMSATIGSGDVWRTIGLGAAAAFAVAVSILGASYAVAKIGSAALGAAAEKPELLIRSLLFVALAEGLAVLGFAVAMMLIQKI